jgi:uroporphyrin-III C-methyltransferase/precorrin-2 dehydrogenase/sirohydrochlorin ferrochelatase
MVIGWRKPAEAAPARMAPVAVLPVFLTLTGKRALVAGGSDAASWKAELLAAAGAAVTVYTGAPGEELGELARAGTVVVVGRPWSPADLSGVAVAVCDAADEAEAAAFAGAAQAAGVPWNVIDRPTHCGFQFGSIVNRSPLVVGISTAGAAPIIGQAVRRRIEVLLPQTLALWADLASRVRGRACASLRPGEPRRRFWERFADRAFATPPSDLETVADGLIAEAQGAPRGGQVTLVGAGPGAAEHLTLKAMRALQAADVILFDDLVSDDVLELARREARRMLVGKRGGRSSCRQEDINALMVKLARAGKRVVRLKSGDPMIFGRAGEEIAELEAAGIPVDIVPGISAAFGLAARLGASLTHRDQAQSVRFLTGHARDGILPRDLDWRGLADPATTLIVYMGGRTAASLAERLLTEGLAPATPVIVAEALTRPEESLFATTLAALADGIATPQGPVLLGIGRCFATASARLAAGSNGAATASSNPAEVAGAFATG